MLENSYIIDIEADGLIDTVSKIHCLSICKLSDGTIFTFTKYEDMIEFLLTDGITIIGHKIIQYDIPVLEKILRINIGCDRVDTLTLSWIFEESRKSHALEGYGEEFGIQKPIIKDWTNLQLSEYVNRCETDVRINTKLWIRQAKQLKALYEDDYRNLVRYLKYLRFKMECVLEQEEIGIGLDLERAKTWAETLSSLKEDKKAELEKAMPKIPIIKKRVYEEAVEDENGNVFQKGDLFYSGEKTKKVERQVVTGYKEPNANSVKQIKDWLFSLGWEPDHIQTKRNKKTNETKRIPQIKHKDEPGELSESVQNLFEKEPKLELLQGLSVLTHRIALLEGFITNEKEGRIYPSMNGFTNTLRLKHRVVVNLPRFERPYGNEIRGCLIADSGYILCGSDLSGIEDSTKRHYIYNYDPEYVREMNIPGYDPHLELAVLAGFMTREDVDWYKEYEKQKKEAEERGNKWNPSKEDKDRYDDLKAKRYKAKTTNFSATYKVGAQRLAETSGLKLSEAKKLLRVYWRKNKAILNVEDSLEVKEVWGQKWLFNPISKFWYSLRSDKDKFSTLNQGTAVYVFDIWITNIRKYGQKINLQYHDEIVMNTTEENKQNLKNIIGSSIKAVNDKLQLNVEIKCSADFGHRYNEIH